MVHVLFARSLLWFYTQALIMGSLSVLNVFGGTGCRIVSALRGHQERHAATRRDIELKAKMVKATQDFIIIECEESDVSFFENYKTLWFDPHVMSDEIGESVRYIKLGLKKMKEYTALANIIKKEIAIRPDDLHLVCECIFCLAGKND